jgi:hypothetical protein
MTEEVGAITGDLEIATHRLADCVKVTVRYAGAEEWYAVEGSPIEWDSASRLPISKVGELHESIERHLTTPGKVVEGNEQAASLVGFAPVVDN